MSKKIELDVGTDAVVIGRVSGKIGEGSVVIGATDSRGNVVLTQPMAVGRNAQAGPGSIAIGANASAGVTLSGMLAELRGIIEASDNADLKLTFHELTIGLRRAQKDKAKIRQLWEALRASATLNGAIGLVAKATDLLRLVAG